MSAADLAILLRLKDEASAGLEKFGSGVGRMGALMATGMAAAGSGIAAGVAVGVKAAGDLEQAVANISTIKPEIDTSAVFSALDEMSTRVPQSSAQLGDALYNVFSSMSVNTEEAMGLVETFARGAVGAQTDAETFGTSIMGVLNAYGLAAKDATHISDVFFNTVNAGVVTGEELASSLGPVTQAAKAAGVSVDELGAMIAGVTKEGGPAAQNINNLNNFLQKITTKESQNELRALGIATTDATGKFRPTVDVLADLKTRLGGMTEAARANALQAIFPDSQARQGAMTLMSQLDMVNDAIEVNKTQAGSAAAAYEKMSATFNSQVKLAMNAVMSVLTQVGVQVLPLITPLITAFAQWLPGAFKAAQAAVGPLLSALAPMIAILGDVGRTIMQALGGDWSPDASIDPIVNAVGMVTVALRGLFALFSGESMGMGELFNLAAVLTTLFGPAATSMILDFARLAGEAFRAFAEATMAAVGGVVAWFTENWPLIEQLGAQVVMGLAVLWETHGASIVTAVQSVWTIITNVIGGAVDTIGSVVRALLQVFTGDVGGALDTLGGLFERQWTRIGEIVSAAVTGLMALLDIATGGMLTTVGQWMTDTVTAISDGMTAIGDAITSGWDAVKTLVGSVLPAIRTAILAVWNLLPEDIRRDLVLIATHIATQGAVWATNITNAGAAMATNIATKLGEMVTALTTWATVTFLGPITAMVEPVGAEVTKVGGGMLTALTTKLGEIITELGTWATNFLTPITGLIATAGAEAGRIGSAIVERIASAITGGLQSIRNAAYSAARAALDSAMSVLGVPSGGGGGDGGEEIEGRAIGGPVSRGVPYWVGERGPELFVPGMSGAIVPTGALSAAGGAGFGGGYVGGGTTVVNLTVNGSVLTDRDLQEVIGQAFDDSLRYGGRLGRYG